MKPRALIGPTGYGSFGIVWKDFPVMEERGGYSGPFDTQEDAEQRAKDIVLYWTDCNNVEIESVENVNAKDLQ